MDADENDPAGHEWMESQGWAYLDVGCWLLKTEDGITADADQDYWYVGLQLNTSVPSIQIVGTDNADGIEVAVRCRTRGDIRRIQAVFGVPMDDPTPNP